MSLHTSTADLRSCHLGVYARADINNHVFTSVEYKRLTTRNNHTVAYQPSDLHQNYSLTTSTKAFGIIQCYIHPVPGVPDSAVAIIQPTTISPVIPTCLQRDPNISDNIRKWCGTVNDEQCWTAVSPRQKESGLLAIPLRQILHKCVAVGVPDSLDFFVSSMPNTVESD